MTQTIFSLKVLGACWAGVLVSLGSGAIALQVTEPSPAPPVVIQAMAAPVAKPPAIAPPLAVAPMPFKNRSLVALLPPPVHTAPLPIPPVPPVRRLAHAEPRHVVPVYAAQPVQSYEPSSWGPASRYPISRYQPYAYAAPPSYYGW